MITGLHKEKTTSVRHFKSRLEYALKGNGTIKVNQNDLEALNEIIEFYNTNYKNAKEIEPLPETEVDERSRIIGILDGLRICKEEWAQGTLNHESIRENAIYYKDELESLTNKTT